MVLWRVSTFESKEGNGSVGSTVNLNCPFLLSNRRRMEFEGGIVTAECMTCKKCIRKENSKLGYGCGIGAEAL